MKEYYKIEVSYDKAIDAYTISVNGLDILTCLSEAEVRQVKIGEVIKFYEEV